MKCQHNVSVHRAFSTKFNAFNLRLLPAFISNAVVLWNTIYMQAALDHLRGQGEAVNDEDIARLSPLCHGHINMLGH